MLQAIGAKGVQGVRCLFGRGSIDRPAHVRPGRSPADHVGSCLSQGHSSYWILADGCCNSCATSEEVTRLKIGKKLVQPGKSKERGANLMRTPLPVVQTYDWLSKCCLLGRVIAKQRSQSPYAWWFVRPCRVWIKVNQ